MAATSLPNSHFALRFRARTRESPPQTPCPEWFRKAALISQTQIPQDSVQLCVPVPLCLHGNGLVNLKKVWPIRPAREIHSRAKEKIPRIRLIENAGRKNIELVRLVSTTWATFDAVSRLLDFDVMRAGKLRFPTSDVLALNSYFTSLHVDLEVRIAIFIEPFDREDLTPVASRTEGIVQK